jgi:hypothetical protein
MQLPKNAKQQVIVGIFAKPELDFSGSAVTEA